MPLDTATVEEASTPRGRRTGRTLHKRRARRCWYGPGIHGTRLERSTPHIPNEDTVINMTQHQVGPFQFPSRANYLMDERKMTTLECITPFRFTTSLASALLCIIAPFIEHLSLAFRFIGLVSEFIRGSVQLHPHANTPHPDMTTFLLVLFRNSMYTNRTVIKKFWTLLTAWKRVIVILVFM